MSPKKCRNTCRTRAEHSDNFATEGSEIQEEIDGHIQILNTWPTEQQLNYFSLDPVSFAEMADSTLGGRTGFMWLVTLVEFGRGPSLHWRIPPPGEGHFWQKRPTMPRGRGRRCWLSGLGHRWLRETSQTGLCCYPANRQGGRWNGCGLTSQPTGSEEPSISAT
jgi:hypothetical protein